MTETNKYILAQYSFDDGEGFYYILNTPENISYLDEFEKVDNNSKFYILKNKNFSEDIVNIVTSGSGLNELSCGSFFYKCNNIDDIKKGYLVHN